MDNLLFYKLKEKKFTNNIISKEFKYLISYNIKYIIILKELQKNFPGLKH